MEDSKAFYKEIINASHCKLLDINDFFFHNISASHKK